MVTRQCQVLFADSLRFDQVILFHLLIRLYPQNEWHVIMLTCCTIDGGRFLSHGHGSCRLTSRADETGKCN